MIRPSGECGNRERFADVLLWIPLFTCVVLAIATVACGSSSSQIFSEFMSELEDGASCEELFAKRLSAKRSLEPSDPIIDQIGTK